MKVVLLLGDLSLYGASFAGFVFCAFYSLTARWWSTEEGWHLFTWSAATDVVLIYTSYAVAGARGLVPKLSTDAQPIIRLAIFGSFLLLILWRFSLVARRQRQAFQRRRQLTVSAIPPIDLTANTRRARPQDVPVDPEEPK
jgi:hypothetical protein